MYIENQETYYNIYFGKYPVRYNGCGPVAIYNLFFYRYKKIFNDVPFTFINILETLEKQLYFGGKFGLMPWQMNKYLQENFAYPKKKILSLQSVEDYFKSNPSKVFIMFYFTMWHTAHYVFIDKDRAIHNNCGQNLQEIVEKAPIKTCIVWAISS